MRHKYTSTKKSWMLSLMLMSGLIFQASSAEEKPEKVKKVVHIKNGRVEISSSVSEFPFDLQYKGIIELSKDNKQIVGISANGFVEINRVAFGNNRRLYIHADEKGKLKYDYFVGKNPASFEPEGRKWLADILPNIVKQSNLGVESRVRHIYNDKGMNGILELLENTHGKVSYSSEWSFFSIKTTRSSGSSVSRNTILKTLVFDNKIKNQDLVQVINEVGDIRSNSTKGTLLRFILENYELNVSQRAAILEATSTHDYNTERGSTLRIFNKFYSDDFVIRKTYFDIIDDMEINSEKGNVLKDLVKMRKLSIDSWISMLQAIDNFSSEREKGALLLFLIPRLPDNEEVMEAFREVLDDMSDSYYVLKGEITNALLDSALSSGGGKGNKTMLLTYLRTSTNINSSSQRGQILRKANRLFIDDDEIIETYFDVLEGLSSEMEMYNVLLDLLNKNKLSDVAIYQLLRSLDRLVGDYQHGAGAVMREVINQFPLNSTNMNQFFRLIGHMDQNSTIEELLRKVIDHPVMNEDIALKVIESTQQIDVDVEKASVLVRLSPHINGNNSSVNYVFKSMAKDIESEYEKNRVLRTLQ